MSIAQIIGLVVGGFFLLMLADGMKGPKHYPGQSIFEWSLKDAVALLGFAMLFGTSIALFVLDAI